MDHGSSKAAALKRARAILDEARPAKRDAYPTIVIEHQVVNVVVNRPISMGELRSLARTAGKRAAARLLRAHEQQHQGDHPYHAALRSAIESALELRPDLAADFQHWLRYKLGVDSPRNLSLEEIEFAHRYLQAAVDLRPRPDEPPF